MRTAGARGYIASIRFFPEFIAPNIRNNKTKEKLDRLFYNNYFVECVSFRELKRKQPEDEKDVNE